MELNDSNVIEVLNELLPYIEADGGWLEYVETDYLAEGDFVKVRLGGACWCCYYARHGTGCRDRGTNGNGFCWL